MITCLCGYELRDPAVNVGYDFYCGICDEDVKIRTGAVCPIDPLYCDNHDSHRCFNTDEGRGGIVLNDE